MSIFLNLFEKSPVLFHGGQRFDDFQDAPSEFRVRERPDGWGIQIQHGNEDWMWWGHAYPTKEEAEKEMEKVRYPATIYGTDDPDVAASYAGQFPSNEAEIKVLRMHMKNPLDLRDPQTFEKWVGFNPTEGDYTSPSRNMAANSHPLRSGSPLLQKIKNAGYDGVIFWDTDNLNRGAHTSYVVFSKSNVKRARNPFKSKTFWEYPLRDRWGTKKK